MGTQQYAEEIKALLQQAATLANEAFESTGAMQFDWLGYDLCKLRDQYFPKQQDASAP